MSEVKLEDVRAVLVHIDCEVCKGSGLVKDEAYRKREPNSGAMMRCPLCGGRKVQVATVPWHKFKQWTNMWEQS